MEHIKNFKQERLSNLSVLSTEAENLKKLKLSSAMNTLINKFDQKQAKSIYLNCLANLAPRSIVSNYL